MDIDENEIIDMDCESLQTNGHNEHWFCFDDSLVTCVTQQHIQKHYGLNDCAYMLFYRLKKSNRNNNNSIPQWLIDEINEKNKILQEKRLF
jgi:hypothetical protein